MTVEYGMNVPSDIHIIQRGSKHFSQETTRDGISGDIKPLIELTAVGDRLQISFVCSGGGFRLGAILTAAISYAKARGYRRIELEDDAFFVTPCPHRALFRRAFEGKPGIYESKGWRPLRDTAPLIATLASYTVSDARDLQSLMKEATRPCSPRNLGSPVTPVMPNNGGRFGAWVNSQTNRVLRYYYNTLLVLSADRWRNKINGRGDISATTKAFLLALHEFRMANKLLVWDL